MREQVTEPIDCYGLTPHFVIRLVLHHYNLVDTLDFRAVENISMEGKNLGLAKVSSSRDVSVNGGRRWRSG